MAKLVTKFKYLKPHARQSVGGYAKYIATRPRAERFGSHGLFTDDGVGVKLSQVSEELNRYEGNVWTIIISLHPHVHLMVYADDKAKPYLSKRGIHKLRSEFAKDIFAQDLLCVYEKQMEYRDSLRQESRTVMQEVLASIQADRYENQKLEELLVELSERLVHTKGMLSDSSVEETEIRKVMMEHSKQNIFLCSSDKYGKSYLYNLCSHREIDVIISDVEVQFSNHHLV